jgi:hypothetical protein
MLPKTLRRMVTIATALSAVAFTAGLVAATISPSAPILQGGSEGSVQANPIAWLNLTGAAVKAVPSTAPGAASTTAGSPTIVGAGKGYGLNTLSAGAEAEVIAFAFTSSTPTSTEIEVEIGVTTTSTTTTTVYLETPSTSFSGTVDLYFQLAPAGGTFTLAGATTFVQTCASVGSCP